MTRPVVLVDCDGVLSAFAQGFVSVVCMQTGKSFVTADVDRYDIRAALGLTKEQFDDCAAIVNEPGFCRSLAVIPNAQNGVAALESIADVYIVTSPWNSCRTWTYEREAWLKEHFDIPHSRVIHTSAKHLVRGDMLIDDKTSTVEQWRAAWPGALAVQWQTPHNRNDAWDGLSTNRWSQVVEWLHGPRVDMGLLELAEATR